MIWRRLIAFPLILLLLIKVSELNATDEFDGRRLFFDSDQRLDIDGAAESDQPSSDTLKQSQESISPAARREPTLTFDGALRSEGRVRFWINGMPWLQSMRIPGVRTLNWNESSGHLAVTLSNGSEYTLLPGDSVTFADEPTASSKQFLTRP